MPNFHVRNRGLEKSSNLPKVAAAELGLEPVSVSLQVTAELKKSGTMGEELGAGEWQGHTNLSHLVLHPRVQRRRVVRWVWWSWGPSWP